MTNDTENEPQLYVNYECSKCRSALAILDEKSIGARRVRYLEEPPTRADLERLMRMLAIDDPRQMMRTGEAVYTELGLADATPAALLDAITKHPILLERPIFVVGDRAVIARPPERLLELL
ncbi:MAG TPA: arsenate reductase (glutaredoxin) [Acidimicrobiales bacterium]|nr:arsenate reductase (glutaredoxin) [Acidimicrobiales bacterium]